MSQNPRAPLIQAKLHIPAVSENGVARPRLLERLNTSLTVPLTLVAASAGFGKTSLVVSWCAQLKNIQVAWLSLDAGDDDPARFLTYLAAALETVDRERVGGVALLLETVPPVPPLQILTTLLNSLNERTEPLVLVLDDVHTLGSETVTALLGFLTEHCPPCLHLVLVTRADPVLPLARYRARGQLNELRMSDLRFTLAEASAFLNRTMQLHLADEQIRLLETRTEGWIAGLQLAALSLRDHSDRAQFLDAFGGSHRFVLDYLVDQVLLQQSPVVQDFLLVTSLLERVNAPLANALLEREDGQAVLEWLDAHNLFLVPLDDRREWYRYHHLFAEFLRHRLRQQHAERAQEIYRRAAEWHAAHDAPSEAIEYALAGGELELAARLVETHFDAYWTRGQFSTLKRWFAQLPEELVNQSPRLLIMRVWYMLLSERYPRGGLEPVLKLAEKNLKRVPESKRAELRGMIASVRAFDAARFGDTNAAIALTQRALRYLPKSNLIWRLNAQMALGNGYEWAGDVKAASEAFARAIELCLSTDATYTRINATRHLATLLGMQCRLEESRVAYEQVIADLARWLPAEARSSASYIGLGEIYYEWNQLDKANDYLLQGIAFATPLQELSMLVEGNVALLLVARASGDAAEVDKYATIVEQLINSAAIRNSVSPEEAFHALTQWALGQAHLSEDWAKRVARRSQHSGRVAEYEAGIAGRILLANGNPKPILKMAASIQRAALKAGRIQYVIEGAALRAAALGALGRREEAHESLTEALRLGAPHHVTRQLLDMGEPVRAVLQEYVAHAPKNARPNTALTTYARTLLAAFTPLSAPQPSALFEPLSARELEVLRLIVRGASNQDIANSLVIALPTVKRHISTIYSKLDVKSRTQAVARAQELELLPKVTTPNTTFGS